MFENVYLWQSTDLLIFTGERAGLLEVWKHSWVTPVIRVGAELLKIEQEFAERIEMIEKNPRF